MNEHWRSISDVTAADLTPVLSHQLKVTSRELVAALVCNLGKHMHSSMDVYMHACMYVCI